MPPRLLSKSRYLNGLQCLKYLWILFHEPDRVGDPDAATQHVFEQGHEVGELAKKLFPDGINIPSDDFMGNIRQTRELLKQRPFGSAQGRRTIFEAGISAGNIYSRIDILKPVGDSEWDIIEVKSGTKIKDVDVEDVAFQKYCCQQAGLEIRDCFLMHINNEYVRRGEIEPEKLFLTEDITEQVVEATGAVPTRVAQMLKVIADERCPEIAVGRQCSNPYQCLVQGCRDFLPPDSVLELYRGGQRAFDLLSDGILTICDIPDSFSLSGNQQIQKACLASGQPYADIISLQSFLHSLKYPLYYLDFETFATAIPPFEGTRPYQNIPFQFSLHIASKPSSEPKRFSFLAEGRDDPRPALLSELRKRLGARGSIIVYNQPFEKGVLEDLAEAFPECESWVRGAVGRLVDLLVPFRNFWYYHPAQRGSASLKAVLPALTGSGYNDLGIANGEVASFEFYRVTYTDVPEEERRRVRQELEKYCGRDTEGMIRVIETLAEAIGDT